MDLYFAGMKFKREGSQKEVNEYMIDKMNANCLLSYVNDKAEIERRIHEPNYTGKFFIDSGAFTMWTKGKEIDVDEYIDFINERSEFIDLYGQIDYIPGDIIKGATKEQVEEAAEKTWQNYLYMRPRMKKPEGLLYTFHVGEPYKYLKQALEWTDESGKHIPYIALGGMVKKPLPIKDKFLETCFNIIENSSNPNVKVHAFGMTSLNMLQKYPLTSADSTSWLSFSVHGLILTDVGTLKIGDRSNYLKRHFSHLEQEHIDNFDSTISKYGYTLEELSKSDNARQIFNALYMQDKVNELTHISKVKNFKLF